MDPVTGIGLTASVIQLVTFSLHAAQTIRELRQRGSVSSYDNVEYTANHLSNLIGSLQRPLQGSSTQSLSKDEKDLIDLGRRCQECAQKLQRELRKLKTGSRPSALLITRKAARAIWGRFKIEEISKQLESFQSTLETSLLHRLSQRFEAQSLRDDKCFASLDQGLQHVVVCLANSQTSLATLTALEATQIRSHVTTQVQQLEQLRLADRQYDKVIASLFYPDIFARQEQVGHVFDGIENSYEWIFGELQSRDVDGHDQHKEPRWDDFAAWLKSGCGLYWINGKAGSGKSTLMNYICQHNCRLELLKKWAVDRLLLTPVYFFWIAGSRQQKSIDGLLRSLIYQILTECRQLVGCLNIEPLHAWNETRLLKTLLDILKQPQIPIAICMFVDGLDEIDGRYDNLISMIKDLANQTNVKICLSSRPLLIFEEAFNGAAGLRLQNLTFHSIRAYADRQLSDSIKRRSFYDEQDVLHVEHISETIVQRANGVFLWAVIAVRDVREGLQDMVDLNELAKTIDNLPSELEGLFMLMMNRIKPAYQRDAARFLQIVLHTPDYASNWKDDSYQPLSLGSLHLIHSQSEIEDVSFTYEKVAVNEIVQACGTLRSRLVSHTAGLLELTPSRLLELTPSRDETNDVDCDDVKWLPRTSSESILDTNVDFLHRTARDFLSQNDKARSFLACNGFTKAQVHLSIARGRLAQLAQLSEEHNNHQSLSYWQPKLFHKAFHHISLAERHTGVAQSNLMRSLLDRPYNMKKHGDTSFYYLGGEPCFMVEAGNLLDVVGAAAGTNMTLYVCGRLNISAASQVYDPDLPNLRDYCANLQTQAVLSWARLPRLQESYEIVEHLLRSSNYGQTLREYLQLESDADRDLGPEKNSDFRISTRSRNSPTDNALAETYLLSCCAPSCQDLIRILLRRAANPMAVVARPPYPCFWETWLEFLDKLNLYFIHSKGRSGGILLDESDLHFKLTPRIVFNITKALLVHGADVNLQLSSCERLFHPGENFYMTLEPTAMFMLEECFNKEPEFRKFAIAIESYVKKPTRRLVNICAWKLKDASTGCESASLALEDCELLWPLIEKWERTGHATDLEALEKVMEQVWKAHRPNWKKDDSAV